MDTRGLLDQLLGAGKSLLNDTGMTTSDGRVSDLGKGAAAGGLLGLLLGSKSGRTLATYGGLAALGVVAWRAVQKHRTGQSGEPAVEDVPGLEPPQSRLVLRAVLHAARVDGHIDARERALIDQEISRLGGDPALRTWVEAELNAPLDPQAIARDVGGDEMLASEIYLASALIVGEAGFLERAYLNQLGDSLGLDADLRSRLEREAMAAQAA